MTFLQYIICNENLCKTHNYMRKVNDQLKQN